MEGVHMSEPNVAVFLAPGCEEIEALIGTKVYLELFVKVKERWRDSAVAISNFGYKKD